jgi:hypothetical protein
MTGVIIIRGDTFRCNKVDTQLKVYDSIIEHVLKPLKINDIQIKIVTFYHKHNGVIPEKFNEYNFELIIIEKDANQCKNFVKAINKVYDDKPTDCYFFLILRNDLYFLRDLDYTRISRDKILFQWNLHLDYETFESPDQIHFIGGNLLDKFVDCINRNEIDTNWKMTLHNLYNFCVEHFGEDNISYLNYIENPNPGEKRCKIRCNPLVDMGNPLCNYSRYMD